ncbi:unnamed protein product [Rangifer tarandus platyrhynchus]|uniref:Uncharacterized protein n=1 Tax=Rangifer tarandus platyrhynchus TaxID=3082113 RepID=A0AC59YIE4_RANTA
MAKETESSLALAGPLWAAVEDLASGLLTQTPHPVLDPNQGAGNQHMAHDSPGDKQRVHKILFLSLN